MSPETIIGVAASAVTVGGGAVARVRYFRRRSAPARKLPANLVERMEPLDFELVPVRFEISTSGAVPRVTVTLRAVNYNRKPLKLTSVRIGYLQAGDRSHLDDIRSPDEYEVPAHQSREVYCRRSLVEAEAALFRSIAQRTWLQGGCSIAGVGKVGKKEVRWEPGATFVIHGTTT